MRIGNFSATIPEGNEQDSGHVHLSHGSTYRLRLGNHCYDRRCDAEVKIDGKQMGVYRLNANLTITLERAAHDHGRFTFFEVESDGARAVGVGEIARDDRGLVQVTFKPEKLRVIKPLVVRGAAQTIYRSRGGPCGQSVSPERETKTSAGITGLTGHSNQAFCEVADLNYDPDSIVIITLRLVAEKELPRKLQSVQRGNPVPHSVD